MSTIGKIVIVMDGGLIQDILTEEEVEVLVIDYDTDGGDDEEIHPIPQRDGEYEDGYLSLREVEVNPERVTQLFAVGTEVQSEEN